MRSGDDAWKTDDDEAVVVLALQLDSDDRDALDEDGEIEATFAAEEHLPELTVTVSATQRGGDDYRVDEELR